MQTRKERRLIELTTKGRKLLALALAVERDRAQFAPPRPRPIARAWLLTDAGWRVVEAMRQPKPLDVA